MILLLLLIGKRIFWIAAKKYCEEFDLSMTITGIETNAKRKFVKVIESFLKTKYF